MFEHDYVEFVEVDGVPSTFFERWIWPVLGFVLIVSLSIAGGFVETYCAMREGLTCLREDTKHAWRSK